MRARGPAAMVAGMTTTTRMFIGACGLAALLAGCGSSPDDGAHTAYVRAVDAVCTRANAQVQALRDAPATKAATAKRDPTALAAVQAQAAAIAVDAERGVAAIDPPQQDRAAAARFVSALRRQADATERIGDALAAGNSSLAATVGSERDEVERERRAAARDLGAGRCGRG